MRDKSKHYEEANCTVLGISFDTPADNAAFRSAHDFPFDLLSDVDRTVGDLYMAVRDPDDAFSDYPKRISYLIDTEGIIQRSYLVTDPGGHADEVLADLAALQR
ncbi:MAG: redoxin domain-containing protein [Acidimicrobiales bacterium]|nr:redoxin domain-containing protein [Acidimicrobiales bacterium]